MAYRVGQRVELNRNGGVVPRASCGVVGKRYKNGNYRVRFTHDPDCKELPTPVTAFSVPEDHLDPCHCP